MVIITCLDQKNGMRFNHRRQSRDREIIKDIYETLLDAPLYMHPNSETLFKNYPGTIITDTDFMDKTNMFCFVESSDFNKEYVDEIIIYRFDKTYPADEFFPIHLSDYVLMAESEFKGYSHDLITKQVYSRIF